MDTLFLIGRLLYGGFFLVAGAKHFVRLRATASRAASRDVPAPTFMALVSGLLAVQGGASLVLGFRPELGVLMLMAFLVPVSVVMHAFWRDEDPAVRASNRGDFFRNAALAGAALMFLAIPRPWPWSVPW
jgi:uncharacterized membrane protein YphA (DoxX/SURF4 family)